MLTRDMYQQGPGAAWAEHGTSDSFKSVLDCDVTLAPPFPPTANRSMPLPMPNHVSSMATLMIPQIVFTSSLGLLFLYSENLHHDTEVYFKVTSLCPSGNQVL